MNLASNEQQNDDGFAVELFTGSKTYRKMAMYSRNITKMAAAALITTHPSGMGGSTLCTVTGVP